MLARGLCLTKERELCCDGSQDAEKGREGSLAVLLLAERARSKCARLGQERVSARSGLGG